MRTVLDTSVLLLGEPPQIDGDLAISAITLAELHFGVLVTDDAAKRAQRLGRLAAIVRAFEPLPVDSAVAASYGELAAATRRSGRKAQPRALDLIIAATAHAHGARLATANPADVRHLDGLIAIVEI